MTPNNIPDYTAPKSVFEALNSVERQAKAKQLLEDAGYNEANPLKFTLTYNTSENHKKIAIAIASMWKPLGVNVELQNMEWKAYVQQKEPETINLLVHGHLAITQNLLLF